MADFRKWFYALAVVTLLAGLSAPVYAQPSTTTCQANAGVPPIVRSEAYADLVGDLVLICTGGVPTPAGQSVPQINVTIFLSTNITSRLLATLSTGEQFTEALLIVDEPNSATRPTIPLLNCGYTGAPDNSVSGFGVCGITSTGNPAETYDGTPNGWSTEDDGGTQQVCDGVDPDGDGPLPVRPVAGRFGCGRPNVFQGQLPRETNNTNTMVFLGVPFDPPGPEFTRVMRITNIRADAEFTGLSSTFQVSQIQMNIAINGTTSVAINNPQQIVAYVQRGLLDLDIGTNFSYVQCQDATLASEIVFTNGGAQTLQRAGGHMFVRFQEGFGSSWKVKGFEEITENGDLDLQNQIYYQWNANRAYPLPGIRQNVPGAIYNTESGFTSGPSQTTPSPNPPLGIGTVAVNGSREFDHPVTGIASAGIATQGTRLAVTFQNIPNGVTVYVPSEVLITRRQSNVITGVAVRTVTDANGAGAYTRANPNGFTTWTAVGGGNLAVYEVLFADPFALEDLTVPIGIQYRTNLSQNLPDPTVTAQVAGGFAPFYEPTAAVRRSSSTLPVPRFIPGSAPQDLFRINKCACNLLFPFVTGAGGFDTGIALANTSLDPGLNPYGFTARPQDGGVQFWYYNSAAADPAPPSQCTNVASPGDCPASKLVPAGGVLTYVLSQGSTEWGLDARANGFQGYMIAQAQFQYCHAFAYISALNAGPATPGMSVGYLALVLDDGSRLGRTSQNQHDALNQ